MCIYNACVGAAVIAFMISRGLYHGPACLLSCGHRQLYMEQKVALDEHWLGDTGPLAGVEDLCQRDTCVDLSSMRSKIVIIHGLRDNVISVEDVTGLADVWKGKHGAVELIVYPGADHDCFSLLDDDTHVKAWIVNILDADNAAIVVETNRVATA